MDCPMKYGNIYPLTFPSNQSVDTHGSEHTYEMIVWIVFHMMVHILWLMASDGQWPHDASWRDLNMHQLTVSVQWIAEHLPTTSGGLRGVTNPNLWGQVIPEFPRRHAELLGKWNGKKMPSLKASSWLLRMASMRALEWPENPGGVS